MFYAYGLKSEHAQYAVCSIHMHIGWNGLSMPTEGCSVHMPIVITNFKLRGVKQGLCPIYVSLQ